MRGCARVLAELPTWPVPTDTMGGCFSKPKPVEVKIEVVIPEKERSKEEMSPNGKASPLIYKVNGTARHYHLEEHPIASNPYHNPKDVVEASVCHVKDLENGQMREVDLGCGKALLIKESGEFHAVGHKCPHYGAPLVKGVLSKGRVRCPWHGACFNISTGDIEDFPGLDSLPRFQSMDSHPEQIALRPKEFFRTYDIEVLTEMQVAAVDVKNKTAVFKDGFKMEYNKLLIATGSTPKALSCKGKEVENVFNIRTPEDANRVVKLATSKNVVIVGASFLGMEVAAYLAERAHSVSLVELEEVPFKKFFGERVGRAVMKMFESNRVKFYMQTEVSELREQEGKLKEVVLKSGKVLRADVCVVGVGAVPATGFLKQSGINIDSKGFIVVNKMMQTNIPGVFAAGDAVTFPLALRNNKKVNVPHWQMAHMHGRIAALNMLAHGTEISTVPYLWTAMFGKSIRYAGHGEGFDDVVIQGDLDELKFVAFYTKRGSRRWLLGTRRASRTESRRSDEVVAVASMNYDPIVSKVAEVLAAGRTIRKRDVELFVRHGKTGDMSWLTGKGS
ncbi:apoptosis-inducing factor 3 isoform X3 [Colius striatus]|uniref:apoptosis-inducing factor 3 isoform X3 n=1 Tax=Colius striatus TaxID=57412 RepID=UPI002B1CEDD6|nr:apoptosis-inducing factor 3 isoform X3 [Colius striatus]